MNRIDRMGIVGNRIEWIQFGRVLYPLTNKINALD